MYKDPMMTHSAAMVLNMLGGCLNMLVLYRVAGDWVLECKEADEPLCTKSLWRSAGPEVASGILVLT